MRVTQFDLQWNPGLGGEGPNMRRGRGWGARAENMLSQQFSSHIAPPRTPSPPSGILCFHLWRLGHGSLITCKHHGKGLYGSLSKKQLLSSVIFFPRLRGMDTVFISNEIWIKCVYKTAAILTVWLGIGQEVFLAFVLYIEYSKLLIPTRKLTWIPTLFKFHVERPLTLNYLNIRPAVAKQTNKKPL